MLVLLPPSEGKSAPSRGRPLDPASWPEQLRAPREQVLDALVSLCAERPEAAEVLGLGPSQAGEVDRNASLRSAPTARADRVYAGVLYEHLDLPTLDTTARRRATRRLAVTSSLFGVVRPDERIPAYRLSGGVTLPGLGGVAAHWRAHLDPVLREMVGGGLLVDLRSSTYAAFWKPTGLRTATVRVLQETDGKRSVVSHFNKATKGLLVRDLLAAGADPRTPAALAEAWRDLGWTVEGAGAQLDVVVTSSAG
ncbi:peroxide stress protein YaaA [Nocardioides mangrovicus]|uniref:Peroxide stress protein YaaA n=1 Tax=Nocardioides mangrovicus TaxID=2478913 RepID=A0A3L8P0S0_9ACTN|nr:peroxide stress protein YaaA [Nocardioides mangrovicus]RLV49040.1 peroxide stress protein YaaA [Nocardioides mangrovicus]